MKVYKRSVTNWYALCPLCNPTFDEDEMHMYDCFCSTCSEFIFAVDELTICFMCGRFACGACEYVDDDYPEPLCGTCKKKIGDPSFREEYVKKREALLTKRKKRKLNKKPK